jgi:multidrug efflux pump subunit AcrB
MLVDSAIVIVENIYRHMELGKTRFEAALAGTSEVAWPVITSTLTNVASFIPMMFWPGIMGDFMRYLPITVTIVLLTSLFVALVFNPTFCASIAPRVPVASAFIRVPARTTARHLLASADAAARGLPAVGAHRVRPAATAWNSSAGDRSGPWWMSGPQGTNIRETDRSFTDRDA